MTPPWKRSGEGFLIKIDDFLKESCPQSSTQRDFPSGGGLGGEFPIEIENFNKETLSQSPHKGFSSQEASFSFVLFCSLCNGHFVTESLWDTLRRKAPGTFCDRKPPGDFVTDGFLVWLVVSPPCVWWGVSAI